MARRSCGCSTAAGALPMVGAMVTRSRPLMGFALLVAGAGLWQRYNRWQELRRRERWHTGSDGISPFEEPFSRLGRHPRPAAAAPQEAAPGQQFNQLAGARGNIADDSERVYWWRRQQKEENEDTIAELRRFIEAQHQAGSIKDAQAAWFRRLLDGLKP